MEIRLKCTNEVDIVSPLVKIIKTQLKSDTAVVEQNVKEISYLRNVVTQLLPVSESVVAQYLQYSSFIEQLYYTIPSNCSLGTTFCWSDILNNIIFESTDLNYERICVLYNLALLYFENGESLYSKGGDLSLVIDYGKHCVSIMQYIRLALLPLLNSSSVSWDLTEEGFYATECYVKARLHNYIALKECRGLDLLTSICYTRRESELYKECASHLEKVNMNFSDIINMCNFFHIYYLLLGYNQLVQFFFQKADISTNECNVVSLIISLFPSFITTLHEWTPRLPSKWVNRVESLLQNVATNQQIGSALDFKMTMETDAIWELIAPRDTEIPLFSPTVYQFAVLDALFTLQSEQMMKRLQVDVHHFYQYLLVQLTGEFQTIQSIATEIDTDSFIDKSALHPDLTQSKCFTSPTQIAPIKDTLVKIQALHSRCIELIRKFEIEILSEQQTEHQAAKENPDLVSHDDYFEQLKQWLKVIMSSVMKQNEPMLVCSSQLEQLSKAAQNGQVENHRVELSRSQFSGKKDDTTQQLQRVAQERWDDIQSRITTVMNRIQKIQDAQQKFVFKSSSLGSLLNAKRKMEGKEVKRFIKTKKDLKSLSKELDQLKKLLKRFEIEPRESTWNSRRQLTETVSMLDRIYNSCVEYTQSKIKEYESLWQSLTTTTNDFAIFRENERKKRLSTGVVKEEKETKETHEPLHVQNGWTCVICGIVNEQKKVLCDGCNQRHI